MLKQGVFKMAVVALLLLLNSVLWYLGTGLVGSMGVLAGTGFLIKVRTFVELSQIQLRPPFPPFPFLSTTC